MKFRFTLRSLGVMFVALGVVFAFIYYATRVLPAVNILVWDDGQSYEVFLDDTNLGPPPVRISWHQARNLGIAIFPNCTFDASGTYFSDYPRADGAFPKVHLRRFDPASDTWSDVGIKEAMLTTARLELIADDPK